MKLRDILRDVEFENPNKVDLDSEISEITYDSRRLDKGFLFIARKGLHVDTSKFIEDCLKDEIYFLSDLTWKDKLKKGNIIFVEDTVKVQSIIANNFYKYPSREFDVVGITGTNGKTSITYMIESIMKYVGKKTGVMGTVSTRIGDIEYSSDLTTPESVDFQKRLREMKDNNVDVAAVEVSSQALVENRVGLTDFSIGVFTNLTQDHLDFHKTFDNYLKAKEILFKSIEKTNFRGNENFVVLNSEDPFSKEMEKVSHAKVIYYGRDKFADYRAENIKFNIHYTEYDLIYKEDKYRVKIPVTGDFNVLNSLAAIAVSNLLGLDIISIVEACKYMKYIPGRLEMVSDEKNDDIAVIVDYAHTEDSIRKATSTIRDLVEGDLTIVVGCGGDRDKTKRPKMALAACENCEQAVFTEDNPRTENPNDIFSDMLRELECYNYTIIPNRKEAIKNTILRSKPKDCVLICGKGHENYQILGRKKIHFDDGEEARKALEYRRLNDGEEERGN